MQIYFFSGKIILYTTNICGSSLASPSFCRMYFVWVYRGRVSYKQICEAGYNTYYLEADAKSTLERKSSMMLDLVFFLVIPSTFKSKAFTS